jgi:hypothetical protein
MSRPVSLRARRGARHLMPALFCLGLFACTPRRPADAPRVVRALTYPPTSQGVDAPVLGPAFSASRAQAAFDGQNFLVVWEDNRGPRSDVVAARVSAQGALLDPENLMLPVSTATSERFAPSVAYGGGVYLLVWEERTSSVLNPDVRAVRMGPDGRALGSVFFVSRNPCGDCSYPRAAFDGTGFAVVWQNGTTSGYVEGARVSTGGAVLDAPPKYLAQARSNSTLGTPAALGYVNGHYILSWLDQTSIFAARLMPDLTRLDATAIEVGQNADTLGPALAVSGTAVWVGWSAAGTTEDLVRRIGAADAVPIGSAVSVAPVTSDPYSFPAALGFDGSSLAVVYEQGPAEGEDLYGTWLDDGGAIVAPAARPLCTAGDSQFLPALAGGGADPLLLVWTDARLGGSGVFGARLAGGASLDGQGIPIAAALNQEADPAVAGNAAGFFVAWTDSREGGYRAYGAALDAQGAPLRPTAVALASGPLRRGDLALASDGSQYLAVWTENDFSGTYAAGGRLVTGDGSPLGAPAVLAPDLRFPAVAYGNDVYLVVGNASSGNEARAVRVSRTGQVLDASPLSLTTNGYRPAVASDGQQFLAVWRGGSGVEGARVTAAGQLVDKTPLELAPAGAQSNYYPRVAFGGGSYLVVWDNLSSPSGILAVRVGTDGVPIDTTPISIALQTQLTQNPITLESPRYPVVSFDGNRFVVIWDATTTSSSGSITARNIRFAHVTTAGVVEGGATVAARDGSVITVEAGAVGGGGGGRSLVAYSQYDRPAAYDLPRVRIKLFADQKSPVGGACAATGDCSAGTCVDGVCCATACAGGTLDCQACSVVAGAATNGTCGVVPDGWACGARGSCATGACQEPPDAGSLDAGRTDALGDAAPADARDGGPGDGGAADASPADAPDAGVGDGGSADAPPADAGPGDAPSGGDSGASDGAVVDGASVVDAAGQGPTDAPSSSADGGRMEPAPGGCGCATSGMHGRPTVAGSLVAFALAVLSRRRRRRGSRL